MRCRKKIYGTRKEAKKVMKQLIRSKGVGLTNVYFCPECQKFHITSVEKKLSRRYNNMHERISDELSELRQNVNKHNPA